MINVLLGLLAGAAAQPAVVVRPVAPPMIILTPPPSYAPLPPLAEGAVPAVRATANLPTLFSTNDYPSTALRFGEQGTVAFAVAIDPTGRVTGCSITQSSGSPSLDAATCSIIQRRARYSPARDAAGSAVEDRGQGRIRWVLPPAPALAFADDKLALVFTVDAAGAVTKCRAEGAGKPVANEKYCAAMMVQARTIAAEAAKVISITNRELVLEQGVMVGTADRLRHLGRGPGETRGRLFALALEIDPAGVITNCGAVEGIVNGQRVAARCKDSLMRKFVPIDPTGSSQAMRQAVRYWVSYTRPID